MLGFLWSGAELQRSAEAFPNVPGRPRCVGKNTPSWKASTKYRENGIPWADCQKDKVGNHGWKWGNAVKSAGHLSPSIPPRRGRQVNNSLSTSWVHRLLSKFQPKRQLLGQTGHQPLSGLHSLSPRGDHGGESSHPQRTDAQSSQVGRGLPQPITRSLLLGDRRQKTEPLLPPGAASSSAQEVSERLL